MPSRSMSRPSGMSSRSMSRPSGRRR
jgi:hypothetical protein